MQLLLCDSFKHTGPENSSRQHYLVLQRVWLVGESRKKGGVLSSNIKANGEELHGMDPLKQWIVPKFSTWYSALLWKALSFLFPTDCFCNYILLMSLSLLCILWELNKDNWGEEETKWPRDILDSCWRSETWMYSITSSSWYLTKRRHIISLGLMLNANYSGEVIYSILLVIYILLKTSL